MARRIVLLDIETPKRAKDWMTFCGVLQEWRKTPNTLWSMLHFWLHFWFEHIQMMQAAFYQGRT